MGVSPQRGPPKFKVFNLLSWTQEIFMVTKYKRKIKFDQILGYQNGRSPQMRPSKIQNFLTIYVRYMKFLELTITKIR